MDSLGLGSLVMDSLIADALLIKNERLCGDYMGIKLLQKVDYSDSTICNCA